ncbi:arrestin domain-containing protein 17-like isoform X1 [Neodiprion virginianus]|uniref:arrestin domain-containing protein 17-like isoform X1 n=1 Tax=Neodiprion virginianus TaxID=2961670 RepID=UPI001EE6E1DB|nr:arrestin domain-containing protein 17-like isoform X1 [Neodiprion virginianus]
MGLKDRFEIVLNSPVYYAGQSMTGKLIVELKKPKKIKGLYLKYFGKGYVHWNEGWGTTMVSHSNLEIYLMQYQLVCGNETDEYKLTEGRHVFEFNCQLPPDLPSSFEGHFGRISYSVKAIIDRPLKNDYVAKQSLTIVSIFDLNRCSLAAMPVEERSSKTFWGHSKPLNMSVNIPVRGFVPGQVIPMKVLLSNESEVLVKSLEATLKQKVVFHAIRKSSPMKVFVFKNEYPVEDGIGNKELHLNFQVPALPPSFLQFCSIIDLRYQLNVKAKVSGCHRSLKLPIEVIIGNIPLMAYEMPISGNQTLCDVPGLSPPYNQLSNIQPPPYTVIFPPSVEYGDLPPPSYEESTRHGSLNREGSQEASNGNAEAREFSPLYPVYRFETARVQTVG